MLFSYILRTFTSSNNKPSSERRYFMHFVFTIIAGYMTMSYFVGLIMLLYFYLSEISESELHHWIIKHPYHWCFLITEKGGNAKRIVVWLVPMTLFMLFTLNRYFGPLGKFFTWYCAGMSVYWFLRLTQYIIEKMLKKNLVTHS